MVMIVYIMFQTIVIMLRMIRFSHTVFALPFALVAAFLAGDDGEPGFCGWGKLFLIVWCMVWARSVAMTVNRIVDAALDARNPRTADRAIPKGQISRKQALGFLYVSALLFGMGTYLFYLVYDNYWPAIFAIPVLAFICFYSVTKRFTWMTHFWLGASLMLAPIAAWIAISPPHGPFLTVTPIVLGLAVLFWVTGFDIIYACQDIEVDRKEGLYSLPVRLGMQASLWWSRLCDSVTITIFLFMYFCVSLGTIYMTAVMITAVLLLFEHILVVKGKVKLAFDLNGVVGIMIAAATVYDVMSMA